jgi:hypothetical protein
MKMQLYFVNPKEARRNVGTDQGGVRDHCLLKVNQGRKGVMDTLEGDAINKERNQ